MHLIDGHEPGGIGGAYDIAGIDQAGAGAPVDRRPDLAAVQLPCAKSIAACAAPPLLGADRR